MADGQRVQPGDMPLRLERRNARIAARRQARATLAKRTAGVTPEGAAVAAADAGARAARGARQARIPTGNRQYQGVILAEFLLAVLIVGVAPLARGKQSSDTSKAPWGGSDAGSGAYGPSPYGVDDFKQLIGIGAVYFILALLSSGKHGKFAAWFGALILVAIGLSQTTTGGLPAIFGIFQPGSTSAGTSDVPADQFPGLAESAAQAAENLGVRAAGGIQPTPGGGNTYETQVTGQGIPQQFSTFTQPGVITTNTGTPLA